MTDKIYLGILILMMIIVFIGDISLVEHMGKTKDKVVRQIKKVLNPEKK